MGPGQVAQGVLFYGFPIEDFVPQDQPLRGIDPFLDLSGIHPLPAPTHSLHGRPSINSELMIRMLLRFVVRALGPSVVCARRFTSIRRAAGFAGSA